MRIAKALVAGSVLFPAMAIGGWFCASPTRVAAQSQGNNTVYNSSGTPTTTGSPAFIDASTFYTGSTGPDICTVINNILTSNIQGFQYPPNGAVVDARGILKSLPSGAGPPSPPQDCVSNPFANVTVPSTVLLPASAIKISVPWVLPSNTRIVGEGARYTNLVAQFTTGDMIDMCPSGPCSGISIEHIQLTGPNFVTCSTTPANKVYGIVNDYAQDSSYVSDITFCGIGLTGLKITSNAVNSGPYSKINFDAAFIPKAHPCSGGLGSCPVCVDIEAQTRGLNAITCIGTEGVAGNAFNGLLTAGDAAIYVNASNNTVEDVHIEGFFDGIEVGDTASSVGNILVANVQGASSPKGKERNTVHICGTHYVSGGQFGKCLTPTYGTVSDVTVLGISQGSGGGTLNAGSTSVQDDVTNTSIAAPSSGGVMTALYELGEAVGGGNISASRFSTSPSSTNPGSTMVPTLSVGNTTITAGASCNTPGSIYSNTAGASGSSVYVCTYGTTGFSWQPIT